jgi:hypothetical protein
MNHCPFHSLIPGHLPQLVQVIGHRYQFPEECPFLFVQPGNHLAPRVQTLDICWARHPGFLSIFTQKQIFRFWQAKVPLPDGVSVGRLRKKFDFILVHRA